MNSKKTVFLTGATGNMGLAALEFFRQRRDRYDVVVLVLPVAKDKKLIAPFERRGDVRVIWGDLTNYDDVLRGVSGADYVLHVGGLVSPLADHHPALTTKVNIGSIRHIVQAIKAQKEPDRVRLVYIGTVAQTGNRMAPIHWGRVGDPVKISMFDNYAVSKTVAESIVVDSGLKYWVSLRQTGMAHLNLWRIFDPILFHNPLNGVLEWVTARDSGRLLANACEEAVPDSFWGRIYNVGGGESCRVANHEFMHKLFCATGTRDFRKVFEPNWFALRNFHGQWYADSDRLQQLVPFRSESLDDFVRQMADAIPFYIKLGGYFPGAVKKRIGALAAGPGGPLHWLAHDDRVHIDAYFGSRAAWNRIKGWDGITFARPSAKPQLLDHGYDESKPRDALTLEDLRDAAGFRGGRCLDDDAAQGDWVTPKMWDCGQGHQFKASPNLVLMGGHWCPECSLKPEGYAQLAKRSAFFRQVWQPDQALVGAV
ncbi:MAG: NAD(P)-dependent oxidoreductase [Pseudomonadota bacterium]